MISYPLVPLLTAWMIAPIFYLEVCQRLIRFWARHLARSILSEANHRSYDMRWAEILYFCETLTSSFSFYYRRYLQLCRLQRCVGDVFNPYVRMWSAHSLNDLMHNKCGKKSIKKKFKKNVYIGI
jgi:hypothetical protein